MFLCSWLAFLAHALRAFNVFCVLEISFISSVTCVFSWVHTVCGGGLSARSPEGGGRGLLQGHGQGSGGSGRKANRGLHRHGQQHLPRDQEVCVCVCVCVCLSIHAKTVFSHFSTCLLLSSCLDHDIIVIRWHFHNRLPSCVWLHYSFKCFLLREYFANVYGGCLIAHSASVMTKVWSAWNGSLCLSFGPTSSSFSLLDGTWSNPNTGSKQKTMHCWGNVHFFIITKTHLKCRRDQTWCKPGGESTTEAEHWVVAPLLLSATCTQSEFPSDFMFNRRTACMTTRLWSTLFSLPCKFQSEH